MGSWIFLKKKIQQALDQDEHELQDKSQHQFSRYQIIFTSLGFLISQKYLTHVMQYTHYFL